MRWTVALKFVGHGMAGAEERVAAEAERDPSDRGQRAQLRAQTSVPIGHGEGRGMGAASTATVTARST